LIPPVVVVKVEMVVQPRKSECTVRLGRAQSRGGAEVAVRHADRNGRLAAVAFTCVTSSGAASTTRSRTERFWLWHLASRRVDSMRRPYRVD